MFVGYVLWISWNSLYVKVDFSLIALALRNWYKNGVLQGSIQDLIILFYISMIYVNMKFFGAVIAFVDATAVLTSCEFRLCKGM